MSTVPVSDLGLNSSEQRYLSTVQSQIAASQHSSSSRAASHASSQGRLLLDPSSLQALGAHFDRLMYSIQQRWHYVSGRIRLIELAHAANDGNDDDDNDSDND
jgi:hypothetical protein